MDFGVGSRVNSGTAAAGTSGGGADACKVARMARRSALWATRSVRVATSRRSSTATRSAVANAACDASRAAAVRSAWALER